VVFLFGSNENGGSQLFWRGFHEIQDWCARGLIYELGNGKVTRFWQDVWIDDRPLKVNKIYEYCTQKDWSVTQWKEFWLKDMFPSEELFQRFMLD